MGHVVAMTDQLVAEYLAFRGFSASSSAFEAESSKDGKLCAEKIVESILASIEAHDIKRLRAQWTWLNERVLSACDEAKIRTGSEYENDCLRLYLVRCVQANKKTEAVNFFQVMSSVVVNNSDWTNWFAFPYVPEPREHPHYKRYFSRVWQENFTVSLHNFFSIVAERLALPRLARAVAGVDPQTPSSGRSVCCREQKQFLFQDGTPFETASGFDNSMSNSFDEEIIDDFALIPQFQGVQHPTASKPTLKNIFKNITGKKNND